MEFKKELKKESKTVSIIPLKDHIISQNEFYYDLKKDEIIEIDKRFLEVLLTENVISTKG
jgi:hypothetical protein